MRASIWPNLYISSVICLIHKNILTQIITLVRHKKSQVRQQNAWFDTKMSGSTPKWVVWHKNALTSIHQLTLPLSNTPNPSRDNFFEFYSNILFLRTHREMKTNLYWYKFNKANLRDLIAATGLVILLKLDSNHRFFSPCDLEIWWMTLKNNRAPLLRYFKLFASFRSHWWIQIRVTVRKPLIWVKIDDFLAVWPWNLTDDPEKQ